MILKEYCSYYQDNYKDDFSGPNNNCIECHRFHACYCQIIKDRRMISESKRMKENKE